MNFLTDTDIKNFFLQTTCILGIFTMLIQIAVWSIFAAFSPMLLLLCLIAGFAVLGISFLYFKRREQLVAHATGQIASYLSGNTGSRIDCDREGSIYKLFHAVNSLATILDSQASREHLQKEFLQRTISDISHQLKTPLAALNIYNGILQEGTDLAVIHEFAALSDQELDRMEHLIRNILKIARLDSGMIQIEPAPENVSDLMQDVLQHFEFRARQEEKSIALSGSGDITISCDRGWILEAVSNLVKNALDHTTEGDHIEIGWKQLPAVTEIFVKDNGSGIHPEDIHHIFKRFYRSRFSKDTYGTGLGLPLVKAIAEAHSGSVTAESTPEQGSTFSLLFQNITKQ